jgi:hypothetical protein
MERKPRKKYSREFKLEAALCDEQRVHRSASCVSVSQPNMASIACALRLMFASWKQFLV